MGNEVGDLLTFYKEMMEEMRERRRIEWQTFIVVNLFYLGLIKSFIDFYKQISLSYPQAIALTAIILSFSWVWFIRIYGNSARFRVNQSMRDRISTALPLPYKSAIEEALKEQKGGCKWWMKDNGKKIRTPNWLFFGYRGICFIIILYCSILLYLLWMNNPVGKIITVVFAIIAFIVSIVCDLVCVRYNRA